VIHSGPVTRHDDLPSHLRARIYEGDDRVGVLYVAPWVDLGGSDKGTIDWFRTIDRERFRPYLITTQPSPNRWVHLVEPYAEEVWDLPDVMDGGSMPRFILGFIASRRIQVVHVMNSRLAFDLLLDMSLLPEPPVTVVQLHAEEPDRSGYVRYVSTRYGNLVDCFSVTSEQLATAMGDYDVPRSRLAIITTGVDAMEEFHPDHADPYPEVGARAPAILWPGRLTDQKDPMLSLDVVRAVKDRGRDLELHVVGDGYMEGGVRERARKLGIDEMVFFHPPARRLPAWYRSAYALLMTSVFEGIPYVIYEAFAMGVPVVVPALPGNREIVAPEYGWLVDPRDDVDAYATALVDLLDDPERRDRMGAAAREHVLAEHSLERMARDHEALYERLLTKRRGLAKIPAPAPEHMAGGPGTDEEAIRLQREPPPDRSVAVIVPCFQHGRFLGDCLASIRRQTLAPEQVIVVDDGSQDDETVQALAEAERDPRMTVIRLGRNRGPSVARNTALDEVRTSYVLPLDADDMLFDHALEEMVEQLEQAPPHVAFIYPNAQHFGNRHDYVAVPDYNLAILLRENVCAATSLFDARVFRDWLRYPEDIVLGHEDWDLVLQLADRGLQGQPARGKTFMYRKRGFSRVDAVGVSGSSFEEELAKRHPRLYGNADRVKARWSPAMSVIALQGAKGLQRMLGGLARQTCLDFEVLCAAPPAPYASDPSVIALDDEPTVEAAVAQALQRARGRYVLVTDDGSEPLFDDAAAVEKLIQALIVHRDVAGVVLADGDLPPATHRFQQLPPEVARGQSPCAIAWSRDPHRERRRPVALGEYGSPVVDILMALEYETALQWRSVSAVAG
jgi:glycosyltransferase involved in cell wall biosynthesis